MANIKNNHVSALTIGTTTIPAGAVANVQDWDVQQNSNAVKAWLAASVIEQVGGKVKPTELPGLPGLPGNNGIGMPSTNEGGSDIDDLELAEKEEIIGKLAKFGITKTTKSGLQKLRDTLAEAEKE